MPQTPRKIVNDVMRPQRKIPKKISRRFIISLSLASLLLLSLGAGWLWTTNEMRIVQRDTYQVVTLVNNQIYFGKITQNTQDSIVLKDTYYIISPNSDSNKQDVPSDAAVLRSIKKADYSPQDTLVIRKENIVYWQNLQKDSQIVKTIIAQ